MLNRDEDTINAESSSISVDSEGTGLDECEKDKLEQFMWDFGDFFSDKLGLTRVFWYQVDRVDAAPVASKPIGMTRLTKV